MKILVTGATGFIGRYVAARLKASGYSVIATGRKSLADEGYISKNLNDSEENYFAFFGKPDLLIHLAWEGLPNYSSLFHIEQNLSVSYYFIKNMVQNGLKNVAVAGTCFEYGLKCGELKETDSCKPNTAYGLAKDTLRKFIEELSGEYDFNFKWLRLFYLRSRENGIWKLLENAIENGEKEFKMSFGEQLRDYLDVETAAEYICRASLQENINGIINIASGRPVSMRTLIENYIAERGIEMKLNRGFYLIPDYEPLAFWGNTRRLECILQTARLYPPPS